MKYLEIGFMMAAFYYVVIFSIAFDKKFGRLYLKLTGYSDSAIKDRINTQSRATIEHAENGNYVKLALITIFGFAAMVVIWPIVIILELLIHRQYE